MSTELKAQLKMNEPPKHTNLRTRLFKLSEEQSKSTSEQFKQIKAFADQENKKS